MSTTGLDQEEEIIMSESGIKMAENDDGEEISEVVEDQVDEGEEVTVLQINEVDETPKTTTEVILIDDEDEAMENEVDDNPISYEEDDDDILMDDEVYTPQEDTGDNVYSAESKEESNRDDNLVGYESNFADVLRYANAARQALNSRHPKFRQMNNMEIVHKMVAKGKVVNPADDEEDSEMSKDDMFLSPREAKILEETEKVRVCTEMRSENDRNGTEIIEVPEVGGKINGLNSKVIVLGGGIPLEPVLAQKKLNEEVEKFRYDLQKHRRCWDNVVFKHPNRKVGWKVDPSTIVPKHNDENDPEAGVATVASAPLFKPGEVYSTDEDWDVELGKNNSLVNGRITAWTFLEDEDDEVQVLPSQPPQSYNSTQLQTASGKYQQMHKKNTSPSPQKVYLSQIQHQNQGQLAEYFNQRLVAEGAIKKVNKSRLSNRNSEPKRNPKDGKVYPKPAFSYSCLIALALKNSKTGALPVSEIYKFMCDHFPYFNTAPSGWKNSVRHNLSLNKCFEKYGEGPPNALGSVGSRKGCLWTLNPSKVHKMDEEVQKWSRKDPSSITIAMSDPENLELIERGELKKDYSGGNSDDEEDEPVLDTNSMTYTLTGGMPVEFGTITSVTGNYLSEGTEIIDQSSVLPGQQLFAAPDSNGVMTYSVVSKPGQSTTPLIIRRVHKT